MSSSFFSFFFDDTATTEIYTLSLHDALPISIGTAPQGDDDFFLVCGAGDDRSPFVVRGSILKTARKSNTPSHLHLHWLTQDRKSTRLNSSHSQISYAVFCLKKKKKKTNNITS